MTLDTTIMVNYLLARTYVYRHHHQNEQEMINIIARQAAVLDLIDGDDQHLEALFFYYSDDVAKQSARYIYYTRNVPSIPLEDLGQQASLILLELLYRIKGSNNKGWADVNQHEEYDDCLALRPWLITSIRGRLKNFITEGGIIRIKKNIFEKDVIEKYGVKTPPKVFSVWVSSEGKEFENPAAIPIFSTQPEEEVILRESIEHLHLTHFEKQILTMRQQGYLLEEIGQALNRDKSVISKKLKKIGDKWLSAHS